MAINKGILWARGEDLVTDNFLVATRKFPRPRLSKFFCWKICFRLSSPLSLQKQKTKCSIAFCLSFSVGERGLEPPSLAGHAPKACVSTISPLARKEWNQTGIWLHTANTELPVSSSLFACVTCLAHTLIWGHQMCSNKSASDAELMT